MSENTKLHLSVDVNGRNKTDIIDMLEVIIKDIQNGHIEGFNSNYTGDYFYEVVDAQEQNAPDNILQLAA